MNGTPMFSRDDPDFASAVFETVRAAHGTQAEADVNEAFDHWCERMQSDGLLRLESRADLKDVRTYKDAVAFVEDGGVLLDPDTGLSPFRDADNDVRQEFNAMHDVPQAERLAQYRAQPLTLQGTLVS
jgi:hypothetical protein